MPLEILDVALVLLRGFFSREGAEIAALAGARVLFSRIKSVFAAGKFAYHLGLLQSSHNELTSRT
jgi:hypothetical protein